MKDLNTLRQGYDAAFLGDDHLINLPTIDIDYQDEVLFKDTLKDQFIVDYLHYSLVMSKSNRQAFFSAANLDQTAYQSVQD